MRSLESADGNVSVWSQSHAGLVEPRDYTPTRNEPRPNVETARVLRLRARSSRPWPTESQRQPDRRLNGSATRAPTTLAYTSAMVGSPAASAADPHSADQFDFAILGAGAIGSILGAHLIRAGHSVAMLARGRRAEQLETQGLQITGLDEFSVRAHVMRDPGELHSAEVLIVAMKTPGTERALEDLRHVRVATAFSIQNGTLKDELLANTFGARAVVGALADTSGEVLPGGAVLFTRNVNLLVGESSGELSARVQKISAAIDAAGIRALAVPDILSLEWSKFAAWGGLVALSVLTRAASWRFLSDPQSALVLARLVRELGFLTRSLGIELTDHSVLPVATICGGSEQAAVEAVLRRGREFAASAPEHRMSSLQDFEAGRPLEIHETFGYALRKAAEVGLSLPLVDAFYRVLAAAERLRSTDAR
jgi:2-dehydropantoate 2-reductase